MRPPFSWLCSVFILLIGAQMRIVAQQNSISPASFKTWSEPTESAHIAGPIYYVGTRGLGVYLLVTSEGHILLDGALPQSADLIETSIAKLGFKVADIRHLIISQAHFDHVGTLAHFKRKTGATLSVMNGDDKLLESGGKADYLFGTQPPLHFEPVTPDRVLKDEDTLSFGGLTLTARHTPGHTRGCTTWTTTVQEKGKSYSVIFVGSTTVNPGTRLKKNPSYPQIAKDFTRSFSLLEKLTPDIFLGAHPEFFGFEQKRELSKTTGAQAFVDPAGYRKHIADKRSAFDTLIASEKDQ